MTKAQRYAAAREDGDDRPDLHGHELQPIFQGWFGRPARDVRRCLASGAGPAVDDPVSYAFLVVVPRPASYGPARAWLSGIGANPLRQHARGRYRRMTACDHGPQVVDGPAGPVAGLADAQARVRELADLAPGGGAGR
ncbi:hypothetical protein [Amycolatopsis rubida]|uniref:Uncharacterized protein n=1 Tax=Amycolatopsis rubida TaxID=112413 RepID=A0A1I5U0E5_9PSEU|nr:hypothetical protein [Amycolatopsis rubida]SFP88651.1 hypothetical protein SAMN05421854_107330 [Amycolatopsis rubida]